MHPPPYKALRRAWLPLLALLAAIAPDKAQAAPGPLLDDPIDIAILRSSATTSSPHHVPPLYSPGFDGVWRRINSYTLVGSTICDTCTATPTSSVDQDADDFIKTVPPGWVHDTVSTPSRTAITVALSVVLAVVIVITLVRFHFTRTPRPRADPEKRRHRASKLSSQSTDTLQKANNNTANSKFRKWTARWRDNARFNARQRRARRLHNNQFGSRQSLVLTPPPSPSLHPARAASPAPTSISFVSASSSTLSLPFSSPPSPPPPPASPAEPPAYPIHPTPAIPPISISISPPAAAAGKDAAAMRMDMAGLHPDTDTEAFPPYTPRADIGGTGYFDDFSDGGAQGTSLHVATDDKAVLARLGEGRSEPGSSSASRCAVTVTEMEESTASTSAASSSHAHAEAEARAPEEDELDFGEYDLEGGDGDFFSSTSISTSTSTSTSLSSLPPPPPQPQPQPPPPPPSTTRIRIPPPPAPPRGTGSGSGAQQEKMELERAYAVREREAASASVASSYTPSAPAYPSAPSYEDEGPEAGPSAPSYEGVGGGAGAGTPRASAPPFEYAWEYPAYAYAYSEHEREGPEAGPSTPRLVGGASASAPPLFEGDEEDAEDLEYGDAPPLEFDGDQSENGDANANEHEDENGNGNGDGEGEREVEVEVQGEEHGNEKEKEKSQRGDRHAPVGAGWAHDTGWPRSGSSGDAGQGHDR